MANAGERGVVAVIPREGHLLVIRRSTSVLAPGAYCFPGGGIHAGESQRAALVREIQEELAVRVTPLKRLWTSVTPWQVDLAWWLAEIREDQQLQPNPQEVASVAWLHPNELLRLPGLLESNRQFLEAWERREFHFTL